MMSPAEINRRNRIYWAEQSRLRDLRLSDPVLANMTLEMLHDEELRQVPIKSRLILEALLERAEVLRRTLVDYARPEIEAQAIRKAVSENGRKGGSAPKTRDPLQLVIYKLVSEKPTITEAELKRELELLSSPGSNLYIDGDSVVYDVAGGRSKEVPLTALKDRLSRSN